MPIKSWIPNLLTLGNLLCGCIGIVFAYGGQLTTAGTLIFFAAFLDFLDGFAARILKVQSGIGKELDSLADVVSFGVLPASIMFMVTDELTATPLLAYLAFTLVLSSALRLAKFNVDERQTHQFLGLPTPASALFIAAIPFEISSNFININSWLTGGISVAISIGLSILMLSDLPLFSFKFKDIRWQNNVIRYIFAVLSATLLVIWKVESIPLIIILYIALSLLQRISRT